VPARETRRLRNVGRRCRREFSDAATREEREDSSRRWTSRGRSAGDTKGNRFVPDLLPPRWKRCSMCRGRLDLARGRDPSRLDRSSDRKCENTLLCILLLLGTFLDCDARSKPRLRGALYYYQFFASTSRQAEIIILVHRTEPDPFSISNRSIRNVNAITENERIQSVTKRGFKRKR